MTDRDLLTSTVHELRNAVTPPILAARKGEPTPQVLDQVIVALQRVYDWSDTIATHLEAEPPQPTPGTDAYDVETVLQVAKLEPEYLAQLLLKGGLVASPLEACAATASTEGRPAAAARMFELARRLRGAT